MRVVIRAAALAAVTVALPLQAQAPDSVRQRDDSLALLRELGARADTAPRRVGPGSQPAIQRMLPDISVVGDFLGDFSPEASTQEDLSRIGIREIEVAFQAVVDPYFRGDVFLGFTDAEGVHIEQAYLTTTALPAIELRAGRFFAPITKVNATHRHDLHTVEYPWVVQRFFGAEGLRGTGLYASRIFAPFGFYQELQVSAVDRLFPAQHGHEEEGEPALHAEQPPNKDLGGLGFTARLRNYWDLSEATNLEISASAATGRREQPYDFGVEEPNAVNARQSLVGADATLRWRPLQQGLYRSFILQAEVLHQRNERSDDPLYLGPDRDFTGAYGFARWQMSRRTFIGGRFDWLQDPEDPVESGRTLTAASGYLTWLPSEFSKLVLAFERLMPSAAPGLEATNRLLLQATFALGPHKPHPF